MLLKALIKRNVTALIFMMLASAITFPAAAQLEAPRQVTATFSILGDLVKNVGGDRIKLSTLVGPDGDSHVYSPSPGDARNLKNASIIFENGLSFEGWMGRLVTSSGTTAKVIIVSNGIDTIETDEAGEGHDHHDGHHHDLDPHAWQSVPNVKQYVANIRDGLIAIDPEGREIYTQNATAYLARLDTLDAQIRKAIATIPKADRKIVTSHDAFGYFAREYGVEFIALQGSSSDSEASARDMAQIIRLVRENNVPAIFVENISDPRLMEQIAAETGARIGGRLYSDSLSASDGPAASYIEMMQYNLKTLTEALNR